MLERTGLGMNTADYYIVTALKVKQLSEAEEDPELKEKLAKLSAVFEDLAKQAEEKASPTASSELDSRDCRGLKDE